MRCLRAKELRWCAAILVPALAFVGALEHHAAAAANARLFYGVGADVEGCPDEAGLRRAVADRVGYDPVFPMAPNDVAVTIARVGEHLVAEVKFVDRGRVLVGGRTFQARVGECHELVATIALSVAIALDQIEKTAALPDPPTATATATATATPTATPTTIPTPTATPTVPLLGAPPAPDMPARPPRAERAPSPRPTFDLAAGMSGWLGTAPGPSLGPTLLASVRQRQLSLGVEGRAELPASASVTGLSSGQLRTSLVGGGPVACFAFEPYFVCGVAFVGSLHADAPGVPGAVAQSGLDVLAGGRAGTAIDLAGGFSLRVSLDLLADAYGPTVRVAGVDWRPSPVAGGAQVALAWRIP